MALIKCPSCGADMSDAATQCPKCGAFYEKPVYCIDCNHLVKSTDEFCPNCGAPNPHFVRQYSPIEQTDFPIENNSGSTFATPFARPSIEGRPDNHLTWAILSTIFCCLPTGIVAIVKANKVNECWDRGDVEGAVQASDDAKLWCNLGVVALIIWWVIYFILVANGFWEGFW